MTSTRVIFGLRTPTLPADHSAFFAAARNWGFILFREAFVDREQARRLVEDLWEAVGWEAPVLIDQEGGRVARLKPPVWPTFPAAGAYAALFARDPYAGREAALLGHRLIAHELFQLGVRVNCAPCLDLPVAGADPVIGDRAFGKDAQTVVTLARAALEGLRDGGVAGVIKHIPGHGRADVDTHHALARVKAGRDVLAADFAPFKALARECPMAMTAHVVFESIDPDRPATGSPTVIEEVIRGEIGFEGLLMTDDLSMNALEGDLWQRVETVIGAGCDVVLHCSGDLAEMETVAAAVPSLDGVHAERARRALASLSAPKPFDVVAGRARLEDLMALKPQSAA
jgi:beta-N-acetylhexosaminidase